MTELITALKKIAEELGAIDQTLNSLLVIYAGTVADKEEREPVSITVPESRDSYTYIHDDYTDLAFSTLKESK
jgi:hypothetical protein